MLLGNYSVYNRNPLRFFGGSTTSPEVNHQPNFARGGCRKNRQHVSMTTAGDKLFSLPHGCYPPYMTLLPQKGGNLTARRSADFGITGTATGIKGMPGEGSSSLSITTNTPAGELIVSGAGSASFAITTNTPLLTALINGAGTAALSVSTNTPILGAIAGMTASAAISISSNAPTMLPLDDSSPLRTGLAQISMSGSLVSYAVGHMEGTALPYTELSPQSLASAVWNALLLEYQEAGSAGKALSTASSGGVDLQLLAEAVWEYATRKVDVEKINGVTITGSGTSGDEWGPSP